MSNNLTPRLNSIFVILLLGFFLINELRWGHLSILINKKNTLVHDVGPSVTLPF